MSAWCSDMDARKCAGLAGAFYLVIIVTGLWSEAAVRAPLLRLLDDPAATVAAVRSALGPLRASIAADTVMLLADVGLAVLLYQLLRAHGPVLALAAMVLRLMQAAVLGANLLNLQAALLLAGHPVADGLVERADAQLALSLQAHAHGYDLGLVFFGVNAVCIGILLRRAGCGPRLLGPGVITAGLVYLVGSGLRLLAPDLSAAFAPAYALPVLVETGFCGWLLWVGVGWGARSARSRVGIDPD